MSKNLNFFISYKIKYFKSSVINNLTQHFQKNIATKSR